MEDQDIQKQTKKKKKNQNKMNKSLIAIPLSFIIATFALIYKTSPRTLKDSFIDILDNSKETSLFDEILNLDETIGVENPENGEIEQIQVEDAITILEEKSLINEKINKLHLNRNHLNELPEESKKSIIEFLNENGIDIIIDIYNNKDNTKIDKARIAQQLIYIQDENNKWLKSNGIAVSESILRRVLSAGTIESYGTFSPEEYNNCEFNIDDTGLIKRIVLNDQISGAKDSIILLPIIAEEYYRAYENLQELLSKSAFEQEEINELVKETLDNSKKCINKELKSNGLITYTKKHNKKNKE